MSRFNSLLSPDPALSFEQNLVSYHEIVTEYTEGELTLMLILENAPCKSTV